MHQDECCDNALSLVELNILVVFHSDNHKLPPTRNSLYHNWDHRLLLLLQDCGAFAACMRRNLLNPVKVGVSITDNL
jgi:hypothetical protein